MNTLMLLALTPLVTAAQLQMLLGLVVLGVCGYLVVRFIPMLEPIKIIFTVAVVLLIIVGLLRTFGLV